MADPLNWVDENTLQCFCLTEIAVFFESTQDIKDDTKRHSQKGTGQTASDSGKDDGINTFKARVDIWRAFNGDISFVTIIFAFLI